MSSKYDFKAIIHFRYRKKKSSQIYKWFTGFTEGNGERLLLKYCSMKCFTFWENIKTISILDSENYGFIINTCHDHRNARKQEWVFPLFFPDSDDRLSLNFHSFCFIYISCDTRSVGLWKYCLPKVSMALRGISIPSFSSACLCFLPCSPLPRVAFSPVLGGLA